MAGRRAADVALAGAEGRDARVAQSETAVGCIVRRRVSDPTFEAVSFATWAARANAGAGDPDADRLRTRLADGIDLEPLYTPTHGAEVPNGGSPGVPPYLRGARTGGPWEIGQTYVDPDPADAAAAASDDRARGVRAPWFRIDALIAAGGAAQRVPDGVCPSSLEDWGHLAAAAEPGSSVTIEAGLGAPGAWAAVRDRAVAAGVDLRTLHGGVLCDPIGMLVRVGRLPGSLKATWDRLAALAVQARDTTPGIATALVCSVVHHDAGATAAQELAATVAGGLETLRALTVRGLTIDEACATLQFRMAVGSDLFLEIAKLRAARWLWAQVVARSGGSAAAAGMRLRVRTSWRARTRRDPWVDLLRGTVETFAAATGGAAVIDTVPFDEALGVPDAFSRRMAVNTQILLRDESHLAHVQDPGAGSWYLETLTRQLAEVAWGVVQEIESQGGLGAAVTSGAWQARVAAAAAADAAAVARREIAVTGVSIYPPTDGTPTGATLPAPLRVDGGGLIDPAFANGEPATATPLVARRRAEPFEELCARTAAEPPSVCCVEFGEAAHAKPRASFARDVFHTGGFTVQSIPAADPRAAASGLERSGARIAVLCGSDASYRDVGADAVAALRDAGARAVVVVAKPDLAPALDGATCLYRGADILTLLHGVLDAIGERR